MATIKHVDPISRIEGHLGAKCTVNDTTSYVDQADVHGNLWRGFENFLIGREPNDAITFTQRICGVCPVPHGQASTFAIESVVGYNNNFQTFVSGGSYSVYGLSANKAASGGLTSGYTGLSAVPTSGFNGAMGIPAKAVIIRNLVLSAEFLMSSITHQYHLAAPSYIQGPNIPPWTPYFDNSFYHPLLRSTGHGIDATPSGNANQGSSATSGSAAYNGATLPLDDVGFSQDLWSAIIKSYVHALRIRRLTFEAGALFAGRMPMTSSFVAGGVTTKKSENLVSKCTLFRSLIAEVGAFIVQEYIPIFLALGALYPNFDNLANATTLSGVGDVTVCLTYNTPTSGVNLWSVANEDTYNGGSPNAYNTGWGAGVGNFLSWGAFPQTNGYLGLTRGFKAATGVFTPINDTTDVPAFLTEHITHSRYQQSGGYTSGSNVAYPGNVSRTVPERSSSGKYSWMKAPRYKGAACEVGPLARMVLEGYVVSGSDLKVTVPGYTLYAKTNTSGASGLDPRMVAPDVAVGLLRSGLATLTKGDMTVVDYNAVFANKQAIVDAYLDSETVITGIIAVWILALKGGLSTIDRLRARALESLVLVQAMIGAVSKTTTGITFPSLSTPANCGWVGELYSKTGGTYVDKPYPATATNGFGATEAPRGALMHLVTQEAGKITKYQCVVPTTWNGSPKDQAEQPGPIEKAIMGTRYSGQKTQATGGGGNPITAGGGVEPLRVAQSFDPCIACAVH